MIRMKKAILREIPANAIHDLTALIKEDDEISVGREDGNRIQLGKGLSLKLVEEKHLLTVSRQHATISYDEKFYIRDHSTNGTRINEKRISIERDYLRNGDEIWFGNYGPVVYEES